MTRDQVIARVRKLLALNTANGATEAEMRSAAALAQRLLLRHGLSAGDVGADRDAGGTALTRWLRQRPPETSYVAPLLDRFFCVRCIVSHQRGRVRVSAVGRRHHVEIAAHVWAHLVAGYRRLWAAYRTRAGEPLGPGAQLSYYMGLTARLLDDLGASADHVARQSPDVRTALARTGHDLARIVSDVVGPVHAARPRPRHPIHPDVALHGYDDARRLRVRKAVSA